MSSFDGFGDCIGTMVGDGSPKTGGVRARISMRRGEIGKRLLYRRSIHMWQQ